MQDKKLCIQCVMAANMRTTSNVIWAVGKCSKCRGYKMVTAGMYLVREQTTYQKEKEDDRKG